MEFSWLVCLWVIQGAIASYLAQKKGRNPYLWFAIGCFFGIFGIMAAFFIKTLKKQPAIPVPAPVKPSLPQRMWYYLDSNSQQFGPMSTNALESALREGKISLASYVWHEGQQQWELFGKVCQDHGVPTESLASST